MTGCQVCRGTIMATHNGRRSYHRPARHSLTLTTYVDSMEHPEAAMGSMGGFLGAYREQIQRRVGFIWLIEPPTDARGYSQRTPNIPPSTLLIGGRSSSQSSWPQRPLRTDFGARPTAQAGRSRGRSRETTFVQLLKCAEVHVRLRNCHMNKIEIVPVWQHFR